MLNPSKKDQPLSMSPRATTTFVAAYPDRPLVNTTGFPLQPNKRDRLASISRKRSGGSRTSFFGAC
jgi:hypothetical protein